jgi:hypothetical protein
MAFQRFANYMRRVARGVVERSDLLTRRVAITALEDLVRGTPVDKGVARSNWRVSLNAPTTGVIPAYAPGRHLGIGETANASAAIGAGRAVIAQVREGQTIYISNSIPYLEKLRNGHSLQQPRDWVNTSLIRARRLVTTARLIIRG